MFDKILGILKNGLNTNSLVTDVYSLCIAVQLLIRYSKIVLCNYVSFKAQSLLKSFPGNACVYM